MVGVRRLDRLPDPGRDLLARAAPADALAPMAATLTDERLSDPAWVLERRRYGIRHDTTALPLRAREGPLPGRVADGRRRDAGTAGTGCTRATLRE